jgi:hypothetical protein
MFSNRNNEQPAQQLIEQISFQIILALRHDIARGSVDLSQLAASSLVVFARRYSNITVG